MKASPVARTESLIVKEVDGEMLVYDLTTDKAHCLNDTAARVWKSCDGKRTVLQIRSLLENETNTAIPEELIWLALTQLQKFDLLREQLPSPPHLAGISRRRIMQTLALATAVSIPLITSIVSPTAAQGASCSGSNRPDDCACTSSSQCASGCCRNAIGIGVVCKPGGGQCI